MKEDGYRIYLSYGSDSDFTVNEMLTGNNIIYQDDNYVMDNLDKDIAIQHIQNLQTELLSCSRSAKIGLSFAMSYRNTLVVKEEGHNHWVINYKDKTAVVKDGKLTHALGFDINGLLRTLNKLHCKLLEKGISLNPKRDIVRRIADVGVLVWVYNGHSVVCYEKNINGITMKDCLIDGVYYDCVVVSSSKVMGTVNMFNKELNKEILEWPLDDSILAFYPDIAAELE